MDCPECHDGLVHISCCGIDVFDSEAEDYDLCPICKEHLPGREKCDVCGGTGEINEQQRKRLAGEHNADDHYKEQKMKDG
ncbi:MAG: hypothetical protein H8E51_07110 [Bacteroidetes bacterium]|nr:hypothetical protein [Bacteroidota bacterium]